MVLFSMYKVDNVMIPDSLFVDLYLKLIVSDQFKDSFRNVLIDDQKSSSSRQDLSLVHSFLEILAWLLIAFLEVRFLSLWSLNGEIFIVILKRVA